MAREDLDDGHIFAGQVVGHMWPNDEMKIKPYVEGFRVEIRTIPRQGLG